MEERVPLLNAILQEETVTQSVVAQSVFHLKERRCNRRYYCRKVNSVPFLGIPFFKETSMLLRSVLCVGVQNTIILTVLGCIHSLKNNKGLQ